MTSALAEPQPLDVIRDQVERQSQTRRWSVYAFFAAVLAYFIFSFIQFDLASVARKWNPTNAAIFVLDSYAYKDHVSMTWKKPEVIKVQYEGGHRYNYDPYPAWFSEDAAAQSRTVSFDNGGQMVIYPERVEMLNWPDTDETYVFRRTEDGIPYVEGYRNRPEDLPEWMRVTATKVEVRPTLFERLQFSKSKVEIHRYQAGWGFFWFDFDSPLAGYGFFDALGLMFSSEQVSQEMSNTALVLHEFLDNNIWQHGLILLAMVETIFMALLGTLIACLVGLPLAFLAARNITPFSAVRFGLRRLFDFLRGVDMLIWSIIFLRAFGPGMFTGIFAIAFTDTGTMGKLMSEAIENGDSKQQEGVKSTGANHIQQHRFGVLPQIMPVFISQSLYYLESNTRGAVIIGAMGAGGIGMRFIDAVQTGTLWEQVAYISLLVLIVVILMDAMSAKLRRALIGIDGKEGR